MRSSSSPLLITLERLPLHDAIHAVVAIKWGALRAIASLSVGMTRVKAMPAQCKYALSSASTKAVVRLRRSIASDGSHSTGEKWRTIVIPVALGWR